MFAVVSLLVNMVFAISHPIFWSTPFSSGFPVLKLDCLGNVNTSKPALWHRDTMLPAKSEPTKTNRFTSPDCSMKALKLR